MLAMPGTSGKNITGISAPMFDGTQICAQTDPEIFFPEESENPRKTLYLARQLCDSCEFKEPCLEYAVKYPYLVGVWAGTTPDQRLDIRNNKNKIA